jgi:pimeloyl-ACP methyl ester carboxylesterase
VGAFDNSWVALDTKGISLPYHDAGEKEKPALLFLHGLNAHSGTWRNNVSFFAKDWRVLAPSLPPSHESPSKLDITPYVKYLEEFLTKLVIHRVTIAGNSMGGWIAMRIAANHSDLVKALVLEDSAGISNTGEEILLAKINELKIPVLILWGRNDRILPVDAGKYLRSKIKASTLTVLDGVGHVPHWETPDVFNRLVTDFLKKQRENQSRSNK